MYTAPAGPPNPCQDRAESGTITWTNMFVMIIVAIEKYMKSLGFVVYCIVL